MRRMSKQNGFIVRSCASFKRRSCDSSLLDFKLRCYEKLEHVGDAAVDARRHDEAIIHYSAAISLERDSSQDLFIKRSKVRMAKGLWEDALEDAKQASHFYLTQFILTDAESSGHGTQPTVFLGL